MEFGGADGTADTECSICRDSFRDPTRLVSCSHVFCRSCLTAALQMRPHCPLCRAPANELPTVPATDSLDQAGGTADTQRVRRSRLLDRLRRHGTALPLMDPFATVSSRRLSANMQERLRLLSESIEASQVLPVAPILPALAIGVPAPPRPRPSLQTRRIVHVPPPVQIPVIPPTNASPSTAAVSAPPPPTRRVAPPPQVSRSRPSSPPSSSSSSDEEFLDDMMHESYLRALRGTRLIDLAPTFTCPYCQEGELDELDLQAHCNTNHRGDPARVVCPICVSLPHGDPTYQSVDFIGHLNLRHRYYSADFMDVTRNDSINEQAAILASYNSLVQNR